MDFLAGRGRSRVRKEIKIISQLKHSARNHQLVLVTFSKPSCYLHENCRLDEVIILLSVIKTPLNPAKKRKHKTFIKFANIKCKDGWFVTILVFERKLKATKTPA